MCHTGGQETERKTMPQVLSQWDRQDINFLGQMGQAALLKELLGFCCGAQGLFSLDKAQMVAMRRKGAIVEWLIPPGV